MALFCLAVRSDRDSLTQRSPPDATPNSTDELMRSRRYTIVVADRNSGVIRRFTVSAQPVLGITCAVLILPVLVGVGAAWKGRGEVASLYASHQALEAENASYRSATEDLAGQIESLQSTISDLSARAALHPSRAATMEKVPAL